MAFLVGLVLGCGVGYAAARSGTTTSVASVNTTTPQGAQAPTTAAPTTAPPTTQPATTTAAPYTPVATDFKIEVIELERSCFGSAGCNVSYRINPTYVGAQPSTSTGKLTVLYTINGADSPKTGSFTIQGDQARYMEEDYVSGVAAGVSLTATPTRVLDQ